jgi:Domain of unknown function (DUF4402)
MKHNFFKIVAVLVFTILAVSTSFGQAAVTATANASAHIITPITITAPVDLVFGTVAVNASSGGTVVIDVDGGRTSTGGITLPNFDKGTPTAAKFTVSGEGNYTYSIQIPTTLILTKSAGVTMTVDHFVSTPITDQETGMGTGTLSSGTQDIYIGATLNVAAGQTSGTYSNTTGLIVTVDYN